MAASDEGLSVAERHVDGEAAAFYRRAMEALTSGGVEFLVGGAYALAQYTAIVRDTKDFDIFVRRDEAHRALEVLERAGYRTELTFAHWLGKAYDGPHFMDVIFSSGNGVAVVDDAWFEHARKALVLGLEVGVCPPEEIIWSKSFILERERFDGADVNHILRDCAETLDWDRLLLRFGAHWRVLFAHLTLFGYVYPGERALIPEWVIDELIARMKEERAEQGAGARVCHGTLLSRAQYLVDVEELGYEDARIARPDVMMTKRDVDTWTNAIPERRKLGKTDVKHRRSR